MSNEVVILRSLLSPFCYFYIEQTLKNANADGHTDFIVLSFTVNITSKFFS